MGLEDRVWEIIGSAPGIALAAVIAFWMLKALSRRDDTIEKIAKEHTAAFVANQKVLEKNSKIIGECSEVMRDCRDELRDSRRRFPV